MKKYLLTLISITSLTSLNAQGLSLENKIQLQRDRMEKAGIIKRVPDADRLGFTTISNSTSTRSEDEAETVRAFVKIAKGYYSSDLEEAGMTVKSERGGIAIVSMPADSLEAFSSLPCVAKISLEKKISAKMDLARAASHVDEVHNGTNLKMPYTGKGVLAAIVDQGVDPNHISFLDENGENRVHYLTYYDGTVNSQGLPVTQYYGKDIIKGTDFMGNVVKYPEVSQFYTDTKYSYHGTHTLNILGGGYKGNVSLIENGSGRTISNPYYGVAPEATLAVSCGDLSDLCVAMGIDEMISYGEYLNQQDGTPMVLSLSLGSTAGPHDPNNLMNQYLEECGKDAILVLSAGNEGDLKIALNKTFTADDTSLKSIPYPYGYRYEKENGEPNWDNTYYRNDVVMIYSNDDTPFQIKAHILTGIPGNYRKRATLDLSSSDGSYFCSDASYIDYVGGVVNTTVSRYFEGFVGGGCMLDEDLGRYYGAFEYYLFTNPETGLNPDGSEGVLVAFEVIGEPGQRIDCFCAGDNTWLYNYGLEDYDDGSRDGTISDMAVGYNILTVGAYNTREKWWGLDGKSYTYADMDGFKTGDIGPYSSYGTMPDGRTLPHVCAPGTAIMSAFSNPYIDENYGQNTNYLKQLSTAQATVNGKDYYWKPETGTSMSTPLVAGGIALWLEADPTLTLNDIYEIIEKTSVKDENVTGGNLVQWGAGKFDALAGLKEVISRTDAGVKDVAFEGRNDRLILNEVSPKVFSVFVGGAHTLNIDVYSIGGGKVYATNAAGNEATVDLGSLAKGVYVVKVNNHSAKIYIK